MDRRLAGGYRGLLVAGVKLPPRESFYCLVQSQITYWRGGAILDAESQLRFIGRQTRSPSLRIEEAVHPAAMNHFLAPVKEPCLFC